MSRLMVDSVMAGKLKMMKSPVLLCDTTGNVLGRVVPASPYDGVVIPYSEEELRKSEEEPTEFTLGEVMAHVEK